jgi:hypothetical protein
MTTIYGCSISPCTPLSRVFAAVTEWSSVAWMEARLGSRILDSASQAVRE